jgi:hypothetical protein
MRQLSLLVATIIAFFIMLSVFLMSQSSSLREPVFDTARSSKSQPDQPDDLAMQASGTSLEIIATGLAQLTPPKNPITPGLTQGHVIMPPLNNETIKFVPSVTGSDE